MIYRFGYYFDKYPTDSELAEHIREIESLKNRFKILFNVITSFILKDYTASSRDRIGYSRMDDPDIRFIFNKNDITADNINFLKNNFSDELLCLQEADKKLKEERNKGNVLWISDEIIWMAMSIYAKKEISYKKYYCLI